MVFLSAFTTAARSITFLLMSSANYIATIKLTSIVGHALLITSVNNPPPLHLIISKSHVVDVAPTRFQNLLSLD